MTIKTKPKDPKDTVIATIIEDLYNQMFKDWHDEALIFGTGPLAPEPEVDRFYSESIFSRLDKN